MEVCRAPAEVVLGDARVHAPRVDAQCDQALEHVVIHGTHQVTRHAHLQVARQVACQAAHGARTGRQGCGRWGFLGLGLGFPGYACTHNEVHSGG